MRVIAVICLCLLSIVSSYAQQAANQTPEKRYFVWATNSNLRESPNEQAKVLVKLPYGTAVTPLRQPDKIAYQMLYMNARGHQTEAITLTGFWQKVSALGHTGYVFSGLLLNMEPRKQQESIDTYLLRVFALQPLDKIETQQTIHEGANNSYRLITKKHPYVSVDNKIKLTIIETSSEPESMSWPGTGGEVRIVDMSFEQALVLFNHLLPPFMDGKFPSYVYKKGHYSYSFDGTGNSATLERFQQGIIFSWFDGGD